MSQLKAIQQNPMYRFLMVLTISSSIGLQTWRTLFDNFAVKAAGLDGNHIGVIQSVREIPGFLALLAVFAIMLIKEHRLSALSILVLGIGVAVTGLFPSYSGLLFTTLIMSFGFHYYETTNQSLTLQHFDKQTSPWVFGKLRSQAAASNITIGIIIYFIAPILPFAQIYLLIGGFIIAAGCWGFFQNPVDRNIVPQHKKMIFRKKYWLFYFLTFMSGARRQIFVAFAVFLLVKKFQFTVQEITILFVINNLANYFLSPLVGKGIIRFGERKILSLEYFSLIFIFLAYATVESKTLVAILYILDHIFFNFAIAIRTYFQKVGDPRDIAPSMAVGFTINHIAAVVLPAIGGLLWIVDYRIPFVCGAILSIVSLVAVQQIKVH
ncbi:MAG: MFS transporter [Desulfobacterales bacterium]|uniref:MFS transporter n=1 Tax=Candidatus Desulfatibia vada TaxID=2841696 RepID=A0A8J6P3B9_9BACT|nr:MFS transporter [Candidatus Desulfatibia vada]MBL6970576.1 MFS transporter [Desulfobacterales bacterium]